MPAIEVTQYVAPSVRGGNALPLARLPAVANTVYNLGEAAVPLNARTALISVYAEADTRFQVGTGTPAADQTSILLKAGTRSDFEVDRGCSFHAVADA